MTIRARNLALGAALALLPAASTACGLDDPNSIAALRGALQLAYPQALHVKTAVWQAQLDRALPRDPLLQRGDLSPEARARLRLLRANALLSKFTARLTTGSSGTPRPGVAIVLVGPVLWSRIESGDGPVRAQIHVAGPERGDVVVVTDVAVVEAIAEGQIDATLAIAMDVMRLYGSPAETLAAYDWLTAATRT